MNERLAAHRPFYAGWLCFRGSGPSTKKTLYSTTLPACQRATPLVRQVGARQDAGARASNCPGRDEDEVGVVLGRV